MDLDQEICLCFHVSRRKIESFIRIEKPQRTAQLAECFGAGTGCGWCRKYLEAIFEAARALDSEPEKTGRMGPGTTGPPTIPTADQYAAMRHEYRRDRDSESGPESEIGENENGKTEGGDDLS